MRIARSVLPNLHANAQSVFHSGLRLRLPRSAGWAPTSMSPTTLRRAKQSHDHLARHPYAAFTVYAAFGSCASTVGATAEASLADFPAGGNICHRHGDRRFCFLWDCPRHDHTSSIGSRLQRLGTQVGVTHGHLRITVAQDLLHLIQRPATGYQHGSESVAQVVDTDIHTSQFADAIPRPRD